MTIQTNVLICGDCVNEMEQLPNESIDLVITDPPYGIMKKEFAFENFDVDWIRLWLSQLHRVLKPDGAVYSFYSQFHIHIFQPLLMEHFKLHNIIVWHYPNNCGGYAGFLAGKHCYSKRWQPIFFASKGAPRHSVRTKWQRYHTNNYDVITEPVPQRTFRQDRKIHPMQKPINLIKRLILASSEQDELILDPFAGSGTTLVAAKELGRDYIGIEISQEYCDIAQKRIRKRPKGLVL